MYNWIEARMCGFYDADIFKITGQKRAVNKALVSSTKGLQRKNPAGAGFF
jgi:hypothetical protein